MTAVPQDYKLQPQDGANLQEMNMWKVRVCHKQEIHLKCKAFKYTANMANGTGYGFFRNISGVKLCHYRIKRQELLKM